MARIKQELINRACKANLIAYCQSKGFALKKEGKEYILKDYDSLYISIEEPWKWYRHSTGEGGKAIDFCKKFLGMSFTEAVTELTGELPTLEQEQLTPTKYTPDCSTNQKRVIAYLVKKRMLDYKIVTEAIQKHHLRQDKNGNCVFQIFDFSGNLVGAELHGTGDTRFKGQASEQDGFGYSIKFSETPEKIFFFESAIDLLSFVQLYREKLNNSALISMGGLKSAVFYNYKRHYPESELWLCVDCDERGLDFAKQMKKETKCYAFFPEDRTCKDWNELLKKKCLLEKK